VVFGPDRATLRGWRNAMTPFVSQRLGLTVKEEATRLGPVSVGVSFLGFRVWPRQIRLDSARVRRFRRHLRRIDAALAAGRIDEQTAAASAGARVAWASQANSLGLRRSYYARRLPTRLERGK